MRIVPRAGWRAALAAFSAATVLSGAAFGQSLASSVNEVSERVETLRGQLSQLQPAMTGGQISLDYSFATAYVDARYLYHYDDYDAVVDLLLPLVEDDRHRSNGGYAEAVYILAESLFHQRNFLMAEHYYQRLSDHRTYGLDAAGRRIEIAVAMGRFAELEGLYRELESRSGNGADDQIAYVRGKALYFQERYADALRVFQGISADADVYDRAQYFTGVTHARLEQLDAAYASFTQVLERLGDDRADEPEEVTDLRDLSRLAQGRIYYEQEAWVDALNAYVAVPRTSPHYPAALFEIAWTQIRVGEVADDRAMRDRNYMFALDNLEILGLVADNDSRFQAQAQLLRGDLLLRMERYDEAVAQFERANGQYLPVEQELRALRDENRNPNAFFQAIVQPEEGSLRLPVAAQPWFDTDPELERALIAIRDVDTLRAEIEESRLLISQLQAALNEGGRLNAFPALSEAWARNGAIQVEIADLMVMLVDAESAAISPSLNSGDAAQYSALRRHREGLQAQVSRQPRSYSEHGDRERMVVDEISGLILETHEAELQIDAELEDLEALRGLYFERAGSAPNAELRDLRSSIDREARRLEQARENAIALRRELMVRQVDVGATDAVGNAERQARAAFIRALTDEERFLAARRNLAPAGNSAYGTIDRNMNALLELDQSCEAIYPQLDQLAMQRTSEIRSAVAREQINVDRYAALLPSADAESRATAGAVAFNAFENIYLEFSELTLRANLGIIDVAWRQKEVLSNTIEDLFDERNQSIRELDADFQELLEDE